jgi:dimethylamine/trimethylamine dehydrogenase
MGGSRPVGPTVVVYDCDGYYAGPGVAELLAGEGYIVHLVTPDPVVSALSDGTLEGRMLRQHLHDAGVVMHVGVTITAWAAGMASGLTQYADPYEIAADDVVLVTEQVPDDGIYLDLLADPAALAQAGIGAVHLIGDAAAPRWISEAVFDGHRLGREIDEANPALPLPLRREPPV